MDRVEFLKKIDGKRIHITKDKIHIETDVPVRISLDGEIQWLNNNWLPDWDNVGEIDEDIDMDDVIYSFYENGAEVVIATFD